MARIIEFRDNGSELDMGETTVDKYVDGIRQNKYLYSYAIVNGLVHSVSKDGEPLEKVTYPYTITKDKKNKSKRGTKVATVKAKAKKTVMKNEQEIINVAHYNTMRKGDGVIIKFHSMSSGDTKGNFIVTKDKTIVGKLKRERITLVNHKNPKGTRYYLYLNYAGDSVSFAQGDMATSKLNIESVTSIVEIKHKKSKRGTKVATVKASPKKSAKTKTVKKTTIKKVMSVVKTESKGKRVSEKVLRASNKPNDKVLYVVLRMKKLVVAQMQENAVKGKKEAKEVKQIVRAFSNQMTGISAGIKDAKLEELKAIAIKLKTVVKDINVSKYNSKMKDIFSGLAENYPQPTRAATKFSIEKDFLDF